ncbi:MAG: hypothetical protein IKE48_00675 [Parasporobacterium sp.]|nr:hypothetical protein [Parasporobacterium sp.]
MLSTIIMLLIVLLVSWAVSRIWNQRIEGCVPIVLMGTMIFLYIFYLFNLLQIGRFLVYAVFAALIILAIVKSVKQKGEGGNDVVSYPFTPAIALFLALCITFLIFALSMKPSVWDELRLWAAMPKALHFSEALQVGEGSLLYSTMQSYPPGMALLIYFFTALSPGYSYGSAFAIYWIFSAALILPAMKKYRWSQWYVVPLVFFVFILIPIILTVNGGGASGDWAYYYTSLYIDPMLGIFLGMAFFRAVKEPFHDCDSLIGFTFTLAVLPMLKNVGAIYACAAFAVALILWIIRPVKSVIFLFIPIAAAAVSYFSWQILINTKGTGEFIDLELAGFTGEKFVNVIKGLVSWGNIPFVYFILFFIAADLFITFLIKDISKRNALIGALGIFVVFLIFLYGYTSHYGLMLSSIHRYTSTFTFACFIYLLMRVLAGIDPKAEIPFVVKPEEEQRAEEPVSDSIPPEDPSQEGENAESTKDKTSVISEAVNHSVLETLLPKRGMRAGRLLGVELLLILAVLIIMFYTKTYQLENRAYSETAALPAIAAQLPETFTAKNPAKTYLALGGDTRKESQRHETYALEAIGTPVNIRNIWCDKLYNEAEDGVVTDRNEMARIFAEELIEKEYEYLLVVDPDEDIRKVFQMISQETEQAGNGILYKIVPAENAYHLAFEAVGMAK